MNDIAIVVHNARAQRERALAELRSLVGPYGVPTPSDYPRYRALMEDLEWYDEVLNSFPTTGLLRRLF